MIRRLTQKVQGEIRRPRQYAPKLKSLITKGKAFVVVDQELAEVSKIVTLTVTEIDK